MLSSIINTLEKYVVGDTVAVRYGLSSDQNGYFFYFPEFKYENKEVYIAVSMLGKKIQEVKSVSDLQPKGWGKIFYVYLINGNREVRLDVIDYKHLEQMGNIAKRLCGIFDLTLVNSYDIDKAAKGSYNIQDKKPLIEKKEETVVDKDEVEVEGKKQKKDYKELLNAQLLEIEYYHEKNKKRDIIFRKLKDFFPDLSNNNCKNIAEELERQQKFGGIDAEIQLNEMEPTWKMIIERCPNANYNDWNILDSFIRCLFLNVKIKMEKTIK